jgi:general secretion pathway protein B
MSLILDALKKSEAERQRQSGPTLLEVRVTPPRRRYPTWVIAVSALLLINLLLLLAFVLHRPATPPGPSAPLVAASIPAAAVAVSAPTPPVAAPSALPAAVAPVGALAAPAASVASAPAEADAPASMGSGTLLPKALLPPQESGEAPDAARNPADDEPAVPAGAARRDPASPGRYADLPSFNDVGGDLPELRLDLHVYAARARDRYALINMHRVHEGDALPEGPRVLAITREGVALDYRGQEFMLHPQ